MQGRRPRQEAKKRMGTSSIHQARRLRSGTWTSAGILSKTRLTRRTCSRMRIPCGRLSITCPFSVSFCRLCLSHIPSPDQCVFTRRPLFLLHPSRLVLYHNMDPTFAINWIWLAFQVVAIDLFISLRMRQRQTFDGRPIG